MNTLICGTCKKEKPISRFSKNSHSKRGFKSNCKDCHNEYSKTIWYPKNKEKQIFSSSNWKRRNKNKVLATKYKTTEKAIVALFSISGNKCKICHSTNDLCIDHNHVSKKLRGILCNNCNKALGLFKDNINLLKNAIEYLK